jgi:peptide/nickel transport system ATP-binding protein
MAPLLSIQDLRIHFPSQGADAAVHSISFTIAAGETVALVGESGSGKSITSLAQLQLLDRKHAQISGDLLFTQKNGEQVNLRTADAATIRSIRGNEIAMIFQEPMTSLNPVFTCGHQVMEVVQLHLQLSKKEAKERTIALFEQVQLPDPTGMFNRYPHQLSGGQKQRVMIAMAMSCNPSLLIADEPTTALDVTVQKTILQLLKTLQQQTGMGLLFITHDLGVVKEIADKVIVLYKGEIVEEGRSDAVLEQPQHPYTKALLACRPANQPKGKRLPVVSDFLQPDTKQEKNVIITATPDRKEKAGSAPFIEVKDLNVWFPAEKKLFGTTNKWMKAVNNVSFSINESETLGLVGESGCGKTTLGRTLLRLMDAKSGTILLRGKNILDLSAKEMKEERKNLQIVFQDPYSSLNPRLTIGSAITEPMLVHQLANNKREATDQAAQLLEKVNLSPDFLKRYPHEFSGGQRQRLVIARALAVQPSFIVWDESVSALDVSVQAQVLNLLNDLKQEFGFTSLFISHDLAVVRYISDRILVMQQGEIVESGTADAIWNQPQTKYTRQLLEAIPGTGRFVG